MANNTQKKYSDGLKKAIQWHLTHLATKDALRPAVVFVSKLSESETRVAFFSRTRLAALTMAASVLPRRSNRYTIIYSDNIFRPYAFISFTAEDITFGSFSNNFRAIAFAFSS